MKTKLWTMVGVGLAISSIAGSAALAGQAMAPMMYSASLNTKQEVPKETGAPAMAAGKFTATVSGTKLKWTLTFSHLTGPATAAHIHLGAKGVSGPVLIPLCGPCKAMSSGTATVTSAEMKDLSGAKTYVNVHTKANPNGEIRGQVM